MPFQSKCPPLRAIVEQNLRDQKQQDSLQLEMQPATVEESEKFKRIDVTEADTVGAGASVYDNPVAKAIRRTLKKPADVRVAVWSLRVRVGENIYALPQEATDTELAWARDRRFVPVSFMLSNRKVPF